MGTADQDIHTRTRGQAYAGLDSGFSNASNALQRSLSQRGLSNSGIGARSMGDLAQARMRAGSEAGVNAYNSAIGLSDMRRNTQLSGEGNLYGAQLNNLSGAYGRNMGQLGQQYGTNMGVQGQNLQNILNNTQQRQANLMGYAQLGRGMSGMANNYLAQAGTGYGSIGGMAGQTALGLGQNAVGYNDTMQRANTASNAKGADTAGTAIGTFGSMAAKSDERLKSEIRKVGEVNGIGLYTWKWNEEGKKIAGDMPEFGVIAQLVMIDYPDVVSVDKENGYLQVDYKTLFEKGLA